MDEVDTNAVVRNAETKAQMEQRVRGMLEPKIAEAAVRYSAEKHLEGQDLAARIELIKQRWPKVVERVRPQLITPQEATDWLRAVGAPAHPEKIKIDWQRFYNTYFQARTIRARYTILDVLFDTGLLRSTVDRLFAEGGFWHSHRHPNQAKRICKCQKRTPLVWILGRCLGAQQSCACATAPNWAVRCGNPERVAFSRGTNEEPRSLHRREGRAPP